MLTQPSGVRRLHTSWESATCRTKCEYLSGPVSAVTPRNSASEISFGIWREWVMRGMPPNYGYRISAVIHRGRAEPLESSALATVNNCAGARAPQQDWDGFLDSIALSASSVFPPRRARSAHAESP